MARSAVQCRDENGFKCHIMSESHQRQMNLFSENAGHYLDEFSRYVHVARTQHCAWVLVFVQR